MKAIVASGGIRALTITLLLLAACSTAPRADDAMLKGSWRLVELQSPDNTIGVVRPDDSAKYQLTLADGGSAALRLDCNRGTGRWTSAATNQTQGSITCTPLAMTRAACIGGSLDTRIARELGYVRTYMIKDGRLILIMMADGGSQVWSRVAE